MKFSSNLEHKMSETEGMTKSLGYLVLMSALLRTAYLKKNYVVIKSLLHVFICLAKPY